MASSARKLLDSAPKTPRSLSNKQLLQFLDVDGDLASFLEVHQGNQRNIELLFDRIRELETKSPADYERLMEAAKAGIEDPAALIPSLGAEIYPPVASDGIRGKDPAAVPETNERVGAPTDTADAKTLAPVPAKTEPAPEAVPAAKRSRGRPKKGDSAKAAVEPAQPAAPLGPTAPASFEAKASNPEVSEFTGIGAAPTFSMDTMPQAAAAADPFGVGLEEMLAGKFANPAAGMDPSMLGSTPIRDVMPPVPNTSSPPPPKFNPFASVDWSKYGATGTPAPGSAPDPSAAQSLGTYNPFLMGGQTPTKPSYASDPLAGLTASDIDYVPDMGASPATAPGLQPNDFDYLPEMPPPPAPGLSPNDFDYVPQPDSGGGISQPKEDATGPWQPTNSMAANFFKAMGTPGGERYATILTSPIDSSLDFMANHPKLTAAGLVGAGLGLTRLNQSPPNPNAVSKEQADQDALELRAARQRLAEQSRRGPPAVIPER